MLKYDPEYAFGESGVRLNGHGKSDDIHKKYCALAKYLTDAQSEQTAIVSKTGAD